MKPTAIIPAHQYGHWLERAIQSVLDQDYPTQIAVFNDGSTDNTNEVCEQMLQPKYLYTNTEVFPGGTRSLDFFSGDVEGVKTFYIRCSSPTGGPSRPRNELIKFCWQDTDIFCPLDADDYWEKTRIGKCIKRFKEYPTQIGGVWTDYFTVDDDTGIIQTVISEPYSIDALSQRNIIHSGCCITKSALEEVEDNGWYDEQLRVAEDYDLWRRISEKFVFVHVAEPLLYATIHGNNSTNTVSERRWRESWFRVGRKAQERNVQAP